MAELYWRLFKVRVRHRNNSHPFKENMKRHLKSSATKMKLPPTQKGLFLTPTSRDVAELNARLKYSHYTEAACCDNQSMQRCINVTTLFLTMRSKRREKVNPIFAFMFQLCRRRTQKQCEWESDRSSPVIILYRIFYCRYFPVRRLPSYWFQ